MDILEIREEYIKARRLAHKEIRELKISGNKTEPEVLDHILDNNVTATVVDVGTVNIPIERIVGTKTAGRITAFSPSFLPLLGPETEFAAKWMNLCSAHLSDEGIRNPIICYEYLGNFYVQEGNKRVSVLRYFGAMQIPATIYRVLPENSEDPEILTYFEFLEFYKSVGLYDVRFRHPGDYDKLLSYLGKDKKHIWTDSEKRTFRAYFRYFKEAFEALGGRELDLLPEEALLLWLRVYSFRNLGKKSGDEIKQALSALWQDVISISQQSPVQMETEVDVQEKTGLLNILLPSSPSYLNIAFVYQLDPVVSTWAKGHEEGAEYMYRILSDKVSVRHYYHADSPEEAEYLLEKAVQEGADVVFATTPKHLSPPNSHSNCVPK